MQILLDQLDISQFVGYSRHGSAAATCARYASPQKAPMQDSDQANQHAKNIAKYQAQLRTIQQATHTEPKSRKHELRRPSHVHPHPDTLLANKPVKPRRQALPPPA